MCRSITYQDNDLLISEASPRHQPWSATLSLAWFGALKRLTSYSSSIFICFLDFYLYGLFRGSSRRGCHFSRSGRCESNEWWSISTQLQLRFRLSAVTLRSVRNICNFAITHTIHYLGCSFKFSTCVTVIDNSSYSDLVLHTSSVQKWYRATLSDQDAGRCSTCSSRRVNAKSGSELEHHPNQA
jgi:hypothetical protein